MKTENCVEMSDAKRIEQKSGLAEPVKNDRYSGFIVPAGILIGLGVGLLVDYLLSGFFVGLGLGLICSELFRLIEKSREAECTQTGKRKRDDAPYRDLPGLYRVWYCPGTGRNLAVCHCRIFNPHRYLVFGTGISQDPVRTK